MTFDEQGDSYSGVIGATGQELATKMVDPSLEAGINIFDAAKQAGIARQTLHNSFSNKEAKLP